MLKTCSRRIIAVSACARFSPMPGFVRRALRSRKGRNVNKFKTWPRPTPRCLHLDRPALREDPIDYATDLLCNRCGALLARATFHFLSRSPRESLHWVLEDEINTARWIAKHQGRRVRRGKS